MLDLVTQSYWRDEAFAVLLAGRPLKEIFSLAVRFDHTPPLFVYLQHFWIRFFGDGEVAMRSLSILFLVVSAYLVYKLSRSRIAGLTLILNPFLWGYATETRHYTAYLALVLAAVYFRSNLFWIMAFWTHNFSWFYFLVFWLIKRDKHLLIAPLVGSLWLPFAWQQIQSLGREMWLSVPAGFWWWKESLAVFFSQAWLGIAVVVLALIKPNRWTALALIPPLLTYLISRLWTPVYLERYLLPTLAFLLVFLARRHFRPVLIVWVIVSLIGFIKINQQTTKPAMRETVAQIAGQIAPGEIVITEQPINYLEVYYYLRRYGQQNRLYSYLYPGEDHIPAYVGVDLVKPQSQILAIPRGLPGWIVKPDASVVRY